MEYEEEIKSCIRMAMSTNRNVFESLLDRFKLFYNKPCGNMVSLRRRNTVTKGKIFEQFCVLYLRAKGYECYLLADVPMEWLTLLGMKRRDMGIDIVARRSPEADKYIYLAVQAKYKNKSKWKPKTVLSWSALSTFYSLCDRTGPFTRYVVMTTADYVSRQGMKKPKDWTIALQALTNTKKEIWHHIIGGVGNSLTEEKESIIIEEKEITPKLTIEELREARLKYLSSATK